MGLWAHGLLILVSASTVVSGASIAQALLDMKYSTTVSKAIDLYNRGSNSDFVYKLLDEERLYKANGSEGQKQTNFTIKETTCRKSETKMQDECEFKKDGMIKTCTASTNDQETTFSVVCEGIYSGADGAGNQSLRDSNEQDLEHSPKGDTDGHVGFVFAWDPATPIKDDDDDDEEEELPEEDSEVSVPVLPGVDIIILEDGSEFLLENQEGRQQESPFPQRGHQPKAPGGADRPRGRFLGRMMCLECIFRIFSKK